jgi:hypothetical protein
VLLGALLFFLFALLAFFLQALFVGIAIARVVVVIVIGVFLV